MVAGSFEEGTLVLRGDVEESSIPELRQRLQELVARHEVVRVDVSEVDFLPSAAIGLIVKAAARARGRGLGFAVLAEPGSHVARVLEVSGVPYVSQRR